MINARVNIHSLLLNVLQAAPTIADRTRWTLDGSNCNLHNCLLKTNENETLTLAFGILCCFFPLFYLPTRNEH